MIVIQDVIHYSKIKTEFKVKEQFDFRIIKIRRDLMKLISFLNALNRVTLCQLKQNQKYYRETKRFVVTF